MEFQSTSFLIFVRMYYIAFDFASLSDLNSSLNNVIEILSDVFLVNLLDDCLMYLNI